MTKETNESIIPAALMASYKENIAGTLHTLDCLVNENDAKAALKQDRDKIMHLAHGIAGSATIYGYPSLSEAGKKLDRFLADNKTDLDIFMQYIDDLKTEIKNALEAKK